MDTTLSQKKAHELKALISNMVCVNLAAACLLAIGSFLLTIQLSYLLTIMFGNFVTYNGSNLIAI